MAFYPHLPPLELPRMQTFDSPETRKRKALEEEKAQPTGPHAGLRPNILELSLPPLLDYDTASTEDRDIKRMREQQQLQGRASSKHEKEERMEEDSEEEKGQDKKMHEATPSIPKDNAAFNERVDDFLFFANSMLGEAARLASPKPMSPGIRSPDITPRTPTTASPSPQSSPSSPLPVRHGITYKLREFMDALLKHECAWPFINPVDLKEAPDYYEVVKTPMDLTTLKRRVDSGMYENNLDQFVSDARLIFENCMYYNEPSSQYTSLAMVLSAWFEQTFRGFAQRNFNYTPSTSVSTPPFEVGRSKTSRRVTAVWSENEDSRLKKLIDKYGEEWDRIAKYFAHKTPEMCQERAESSEFQSQDIIPRLRRNWSKDEDEALRKLVERYGSDNWDLIASNMPASSRRSAAGCKNRWTVLESKKLDRNWTPEEEKILADCWKKYGHQWSKYHKYLPNKPYFTIRKRALEIYEPSLA